MGAANGTESITRAFPYVMILSAVFIEGFTLLTVNGPALIAVLARQRYETFWNMLSELYAPAFSLLVGAETALLLLPTLLVVGLVSGFLFHKGSVLLAEILGRTASKMFSVDFFVPTLYLKRGYPAFLLELQARGATKSYWEWSVFLYWIDWGLAANALLFSVLSVVVITDRSLLLWLGLLALNGLLLAAALGRAHSMHQVHEEAMNAVRGPEPARQGPT